MKVTASESHRCEVCGGTIQKGVECLACMIEPETNNIEFNVIYICMKCGKGKPCPKT